MRMSYAFSSVHAENASTILPRKPVLATQGFLYAV